MYLNSRANQRAASNNSASNFCQSSSGKMAAHNLITEELAWIISRKTFSILRRIFGSRRIKIAPRRGSLSMDSTSIITQVNKEDEALEVSNSYTHEKLPSTVAKKPRNRNIFSSFFCCFGAQSTAGTPCIPVTHTNHNHNPNSISDENDAKPCKYLLPSVRHQDMGKKCVVIDLDETLVHSSFKPVSGADFIVPVEIDGTVHQVYVLKRPHVDEFLKKMGELFECVLFTASLAKYADPVADLLDKYGTFRARLFRESCVFHRGNYVKDLSKLGRDLKHCIIIDNSPASYSFHPENAVPVISWFDDPTDIELLNLIPFFEAMRDTDDVCAYLRTVHTNSYRNHNIDRS